VTIVNRGAPAQTFCIHAGAYDIGTLNLQPRPGQSFIGDPVTIGPRGEIHAPTAIIGGDLDGVFYFIRSADNVLFENLDISGSPGVRDVNDADTKKHGRGINGNSFMPVITIRHSRIHHNANSGVDGIGAGTLLDSVELDNNGSSSYLACCAGGVKSGRTYTIRNSFVHDNTGYGIWCDQGCHGGVWQVAGNLVTGNSVDGIRYEVSMNDFGASIENNVVQGNNTSGKVGGHGGIAIVSSWKAAVVGNLLGGNGNFGIEFKDDNRGSLADNVARGNDMNGDGIKGCGLTGVLCE
jgi:parallel beta-helix repeat protein